ncbi:hypothetical protein KIPB_012435, partial [Kipferlia bialata]|eukprot:g12435.t1
MDAFLGQAKQKRDRDNTKRESRERERDLERQRGQEARARERRMATPGTADTRSRTSSRGDLRMTGTPEQARKPHDHPDPTHPGRESPPPPPYAPTRGNNNVHILRKCVERVLLSGPVNVKQ